MLHGGAGLVALALKFSLWIAIGVVLVCVILFDALGYRLCGAFYNEEKIRGVRKDHWTKTLSSVVFIGALTFGCMAVGAGSRPSWLHVDTWHAHIRT